MLWATLSVLFGRDVNVDVLHGDIYMNAPSWNVPMYHGDLAILKG